MIREALWQPGQTLSPQRQAREFDVSLAPARPTAPPVAPRVMFRRRSTPPLPDRSALAAKVQDPAAMAPSARLAELGAILAVGHRRLRLSLDESPDSEAQCDPMEAAHEVIR